MILWYSVEFSIILHFKTLLQMHTSVQKKWLENSKATISLLENI